ncbi:MAG: phosphatase PAP2 family protein [Candidatus Staskawiczbacteria bacterium]|nr:phosphatase PAP2 family protein [Candidatus Staskawiczbacteria bacterium]
MNIDLYLFNLINGLAFKWDWLGFASVLVFYYADYLIAAAIFLFLAVNFKRHWKVMFESIAAAVFTRVVLIEIIRWLWSRTRPFVANNVNLLVDYSAEKSSFPSGHAGFYFAFSTVVYCHNKKIGIVFYIASLIIVLARIFVGIHWPSDILAGAVLGILVGLAFNKKLGK